MSSTTAAEGGRLIGRVALITGASRGIGASCARALHAEGARLVLLARDIGAMTAVVKSLGNPRADCFAVDLALAAALDDVLGTVRTRLRGAPDIIVNNAAQFFIDPVEETDPDEFERTLRVNLTSHFLIARAFVAEMKHRGSGHVVTIGSIAGHRGLSGNAAYSASKFGLRGLHEVLREELRGTGVRATLISPARVDTSIWMSPGASSAAPAAADGMIPATAVAEAVRYAVTQPPGVNVDELRLSRS